MDISAIKQVRFGRMAIFNLQFAKMLLLFISISSFKPISKIIEYGDRASRDNDLLYFTNISLLYTALGVMVGIVAKLSKSERIKALHEFIVVTSAVMSMLVVTVFWILFVIDPKLVTPYSKGNEVLHTFDNYIREFPKHLYPLIVVFIELSNVVLEKKGTHRFFLFSIAVAYTIMCEHLIRVHNFYVYQFLNTGSFKGRLISYIIITFLCLAAYEILHYVKSAKKIKN